MNTYIIIAGNNGEHVLTEHLTHGEQERLEAIFEAVRAGYDFVEVYKI